MREKVCRVLEKNLFYVTENVKILRMHKTITTTKLHHYFIIINCYFKRQSIANSPLIEVLASKFDDTLTLLFKISFVLSTRII